jgi:hypothetical protein
VSISISEGNWGDCTTVLNSLEKTGTLIILFSRYLLNSMR